MRGAMLHKKRAMPRLRLAKLSRASDGPTRSLCDTVGCGSDDVAAGRVRLFGAGATKGVARGTFGFGHSSAMH